MPPLPRASQPTTFALAALVIVLVLGGASVFYGTRLAAERQRAEALAGRLAMLESQLAGRVPEPPGAAATAAASTPSAQPSAAASRGARVVPGPKDPELRAFRECSHARRLEHVRRLREDPEYRAALLAQFERASRRQADGFEAQYALSAAEADAFHAALALYQLRFQELEPLPVGEHVPGSPEQVAKLNQDLFARREAANARLREVASAGLAREQLARFDELRRQKLTLERAQLQSGAATGPTVSGIAGAYAGALTTAED